jgi:hypothetical protein
MVEEIATIFGGTGTAVGDDVDLLVMQDTDGDGDPSNATLVAVYPVTIQVNDGATWNVYTLSTPAALYGPGDVLIGIINRYQPGTGAGLLDYPAAQDRTSSAYRSWAGWWSVDAPPDPPTWPPDALFGIIDDLAPALAGNWMVRGAGETFIPPVDIPWISADPTSGSVAAGECVTVEVTLDATGLELGEYYAWLVADSNDPATPEVTIPVTMTVEGPAKVQVAHLAPFAMDPGTAVTVTLNGAPVLTDFAYGDSTEYLEVPAGEYLVEIFPAGSATPAISGTLNLMGDTDYTAIATGDGVNQPLGLMALEDDNSTPAPGFFRLRVGHLAPFAPGDALADVRLQNGDPVLENVAYGDVSPYLELPAGEYDLKITTPGGDVTLIDPEPVTFTDGQILSAFATGEGANQSLGAYALPSGQLGFFLPLAEEEYMIYLPIIVKNN